MNLRALREDPAVWKVLEARAAVLAQPGTTADTDLGEEILKFRLGDECYGISAHLVREVQALGSYTPLPGTPLFVLGLINLRGRLLAALDLRPLLGLSVSAPRAGAMLLIVGASGLEVGLLADEVVDIRHAGTDLSPTLASADGRAVAWVRGIDSDLTALIDLTLLLADARLIVNDADECR
jgi:purine-binding chemotaxis protein CheW